MSQKLFLLTLEIGRIILEIQTEIEQYDPMCFIEYA